MNAKEPRRKNHVNESNSHASGNAPQRKRGAAHEGEKFDSSDELTNAASGARPGEGDPQLLSPKTAESMPTDGSTFPERPTFFHSFKNPPKLPSDGGDLSNTPPQKTKLPPPSSLGGEDWLSVNFYVNHLNFPSLSQTLGTAQQAAQLEIVKEDEVMLGDVRAIIAPGGVRQGSGKNAQRMRWRLTTEQGLTILILNRAEAHATLPNVTVEAKSLLLMRYGFDAVWRLMQYVVKQLDCEIVGNKISRVDACIDLVDIPVTIFSDAFESGCYVSRAKKSSKYYVCLQQAVYQTGKRTTGFTIGKRPLGLRVYDKLEEVKRDPLKLAVLEAHRWNGIPRAATRVEFELGRSKLKEFGIDTVEDWLLLRSSVLKYLTNDWFRLTNEPVDRNHADRSEMHAFWEVVQNRFSECYGSGPEEVSFTSLPKLWVDTSQRIAMAVGVFKGLLARVGKEIENNDQFVREVEFMVRSSLMDRDMSEEVRRKAIELGIDELGISDGNKPRPEATNE